MRVKKITLSLLFACLLINTTYATAQEEKEISFVADVYSHPGAPPVRVNDLQLHYYNLTDFFGWGPIYTEIELINGLSISFDKISEVTFSYQAIKHKELVPPDKRKDASDIDEQGYKTLTEIKVR